MQKTLQAGKINSHVACAGTKRAGALVESLAARLHMKKHKHLARHVLYAAFPPSRVTPAAMLCILGLTFDCNYIGVMGGM